MAIAPDHEVPIAPLLDADRSAEVLNAALGDGRAVEGLPTIAQIRYSPGRRAVALYRATVLNADGGKSDELLGVAALRGPAPGSAAVDLDGHRVGVWAYPKDPALPGLISAADARTVGGIFASLGVETPEVSIRRRAYRPLRRAVIEATTPNARMYLKVVRPSKVAELQLRHQSMGGRLPVPNSHGWNRDLGIVVLAARPGRTVRSIVADGSSRIPSADDLNVLLDRMPSPPAVTTAVPGPAERAEEFAGLLRSVVPDARTAIDAVVAACSTVGPRAPLEPVHGDFHSSQVLVSDGQISGLVDVDTSGSGQRVHDLAQFVAHLATLGVHSPGLGFDTYADALAESFGEIVDVRELRLHVAGALLGFASGPFRVQEEAWEENVLRRITLAETWARGS